MKLTCYEKNMQFPILYMVIHKFTSDEQTLENDDVLVWFNNYYVNGMCEVSSQFTLSV